MIAPRSDRLSSMNRGARLFLRWTLSGIRILAGNLRGKPRLSHHHRGFEDDEAGPEPENPGETLRVRGDGNPSTGRRIVVPFLGRWAEPSRPGIDAGSPERPRPVL